MSVAAEPLVDGDAILARARVASAILREEAPQNERARRLTPTAVEALRVTGVFRMAMPRAWGGPEVDPWTQVEIVEELSRADGSAGWCAMIGSDGGYYSAALDDEVGRTLYANLDAVTAGWVFPGGQLRPTDGGYELSGKWQFGSGCTHADVILGGALVYDGARPVVGADGLPEVRVAMLRADQFEILDTWYTTGLSGSGSHDYRIRRAFVPAEQTFHVGERRREGPLYAWPGLVYVNLPGVPLGIARAALDAAEDVLAEKFLMMEMRPARDDTRVRVSVARAEALVGSARSYVFDVVHDFWATLERGEEPSRRQRAALGGCYRHTLRACLDAVLLLADSIGSASIYRTCPIERHLRDLMTVSQHIVHQDRFLEAVGALWIRGADESHQLLAQRMV